TTIFPRPRGPADRLKCPAGDSSEPGDHMADPNEPTAGPDPFFVTDQANRLADGGPRYKETPPDPAVVPVAEPWNAITASLFILLVLVWVWRLWGRFGRFPFLSSCLPI